jgi:hypothetical protein
VVQGLILLAFIAILVTVVVVKIRGRLGLRSTAKTWAMVVSVFVVVVLLLWGAAQK